MKKNMVKFGHLERMSDEKRQIDFRGEIGVLG